MLYYTETDGERPDILLADEPTGNLDGETQDEIMQIFRSLAEEGKCVIIVTHSPDVAAEADVVYELKKPAAPSKARTKKRVTAQPAVSAEAPAAPTAPPEDDLPSTIF